MSSRTPEIPGDGPRSLPEASGTDPSRRISSETVRTRSGGSGRLEWASGKRKLAPGSLKTDPGARNASGRSGAGPATLESGSDRLEGCDPPTHASSAGEDYGIGW